MVPELFPGVDFDSQRKLMSAAADMWSKNDVALDTMAACIRFKLSPQVCNYIINFVLCSLKHKSENKKFKEPKLDDDMLIEFVRNIAANVDMWFLPPIIQEGFVCAFRFLSAFGGRMYYMEQLLVESKPFSLCPLVIELVGVECVDSLRRNCVQAYRMDAYFHLPTLEYFQECIPKKRRKRK